MLQNWEKSEFMCEVYGIWCLNFKRCQQAQINKIQVSGAQNGQPEMSRKGEGFPSDRLTWKGLKGLGNHKHLTQSLCHITHPRECRFPACCWCRQMRRGNSNCEKYSELRQPLPLTRWITEAGCIFWVLFMSQDQSLYSFRGHKV